MNIEETIKARRTIRLYQQKSIPKDDLCAMLDAARVASCASNLQRLRYVVVTEPGLVGKVFANTAWAGLVKPRRTPVAGVTSPAAFIAVIAPADAAPTHLYADAGAAIQSIELAAWNRGIGCCWIGSVQKKEVCELLGIEDNMQLIYVVAVGYPAEAPVSEDIDDPSGVAYYLDDNNVLHIPKLSVEAITKWL